MDTQERINPWSQLGPALEIPYEEPTFPSVEHYPLVTSRQMDNVIAVARKFAGKGQWRILGFGANGDEMHLVCLGRKFGNILGSETTPLKIVVVSGLASGEPKVTSVKHDHVVGHFSISKLNPMGITEVVYTDRIRRLLFPHDSCTEGKLIFTNHTKGLSVTVCCDGMYKTITIPPVTANQTLGALFAP